MSLSRRIGALSAALVLLLSVVVLVGWAAGVGWATGIVPGLPSMKPNTAFALGVMAVSWFLPRTPARIGSVLVLAIGATTVFEHATGQDLGVDQVLFDDPGHAHGRMALMAAIALALLGAAQLLLRAGRRWDRLAETLAVLDVGIAVLALLGYLYGVSSLYSIGPLSTMAVHTAIALFLMGVATLAPVRSGAMSWIIGGRDAGAVLLRTVLPVTLVLVPVVGYARLLGQHAGLWDTSFGVALMASTCMGLLTASSWYTARVLKRIDRRREEAMAALRTLNHDLEERVQQRAAELDAVRGVSALLRDRERIAADLHDLVIQRLYGIGLTMEAGARQAADPAMIENAIDGIDNAIRELRGSIFDLKRDDAQSELHATLAETAHAITSALGIVPTMTMNGAVTRIGETTAMQLIAVTREAVSNAVRHANPTTVSIEVEVGERTMTLVVSDDGCGMPAGVESTSGLANMRARSEALGGRCTWLANEPHGTAVVWEVPLADAGAGLPADTSTRSRVPLGA